MQISGYHEIRKLTLFNIVQRASWLLLLRIKQNLILEITDLLNL